MLLFNYNHTVQHNLNITIVAAVHSHPRPICL